MRRLLLLLMLLLLVALVAGGGAAATRASSAAAPRASGINCPAADARAGTCCGPRVAGGAVSCCLGVASVEQCCRLAGTFKTMFRCMVGVTMVVAPNPSTAGDPIQIAGQVLGAPPRTDVVLWQRPATERRFHPVTQTRTNALGQYMIVRGPGPVQTNRRWCVTARDRRTGRDLRSATLDQRVYAVVTLSSSATKVSPGELVTFTGHVTPSHGGQRVLLEQNTGGGWQVIAKPGLDRASDYSANQRFPDTGVAYLRAVLPSDRRNIRSYSPVVTIEVTGPTRSSTS